jgi:DHA1 family inner membrane transport protein
MFSATPFLLVPLSERYDITVGTAGLLSSARVGAFAIASFLLPKLMAPTRTLFVWAVSVLVVANVASVVAGAFPLFLAVRAGAGLAAGALTWIVWAAGMTDGGALRSVSMTGPTAALVAAPVMSFLAGYGSQAAFAGLAVVSLSPIFGSASMGGTGGRGASRSRSRSNRVLLVGLFGSTLFGSSLFIYASVAGEQVAGLSAQTTSFAFSLNAFGGIVGARLADRHKRPGWWLASTGVAALIAILIPHPVAFFFGLTMWGFGFWMGIPGVMAMLTARSLAADERAGDSQAMMALGRSIGPVLGSTLASAGAFGPLALISGTGLAISGLTIVGVQEGRDRLPATDPRTG